MDRYADVRQVVGRTKLKCDQCNQPCFVDPYISNEIHYFCLVHGTVWIATKGERPADDFVPQREAPMRNGRLGYIGGNR